MAKKNKKTPMVSQLGIDKKQISEDREQLIISLIQKTDEKASDKFTDKKLDRKNEIVELLGGSTIDLGEERAKWLAYFANALQEYSRVFPEKYYLEIYRLKGWEIPEGKIYQKPWVVAKYTNEIIYGRFSKDVLQLLQKLNPYVSFCQRKHKHFQWFNSEGKEKVEGYIQDAIGVMEKCTTWYEFRVKHARDFGVTFQLDMFEDNDSLFG